MNEPRIPLDKQISIFEHIAKLETAVTNLSKIQQNQDLSKDLIQTNSKLRDKLEQLEFISDNLQHYKPLQDQIEQISDNKHIEYGSSKTYT